MKSNSEAIKQIYGIDSMQTGFMEDISSTTFNRIRELTLGS